jgi:hypothetical protein
MTMVMAIPAMTVMLRTCRHRSASQDEAGDKKHKCTFYDHDSLHKARPAANWYVRVTLSRISFLENLFVYAFFPRGSARPHADQSAPPLLTMMAMMMMAVMGMSCSVGGNDCAGKNHQRDGSEKHTTEFHWSFLTKATHNNVACDFIMRQVCTGLAARKRILMREPT